MRIRRCQTIDREMASPNSENNQSVEESKKTRQRQTFSLASVEENAAHFGFRDVKRDKVEIRAVFPLEG